MVERQRQVWVIHNFPDEHYRREIDRWSYYRRHRKWLLNGKSPNVRALKAGDLGILRIYNQGYWGTFEIASPWHRDPQLGKNLGWVKIRNISMWEQPVDRHLVEDQLDAKAFRHTMVRSSERDLLVIDAVRRAIQRLGLGAKSGEEIILLEAGIEEAIKPNLKKIGLRLVQDRRGQQFATEAGRYDLLCEDARGNLVVVEIKRGHMTNDEVVGQCLRYIGIVKELIAQKGQRVRGLIITGGFDPRLRWALKGLPDKGLVEVKAFRLP